MKPSSFVERLRSAARASWPHLLVAAAVAFQYRAPLLGRVWYFEDISAYFIPLYTAAARAMRAGALPLWSPGSWSGQPLVGDPQVGCFYPPNWLWLVVTPVTLYAWLTLVHAAVGAAGAWALARARGRTPAAAAVAAITLALGAFCVLQVRHAMFVATTAWLPWSFWALERYAASRKHTHLAAAAVTGALALLGGGWSMLPYAAPVAAVLVFGTLARSPRRVPLALGLGAALALAFALAAAQLVPALAHAPQSPRALGLTRALANTYAWPSWRYAVTLVLPTYYGDDARGTWVGAPNQWELCGYGVGLVATLLAVASLRQRERRRERLALLAVAAACCDLARGDGGLLHPLLRHLPVLGSLRCPARALYAWVIIAPLLAADGVDAIASGVSPRRGSAWVPGVLLLAVTTELLVTWRSENPSVERALAQRVPGAVAWVQEQPPGGRTSSDWQLPRRFHNVGLAWNLEGAGGYHSLPIWRYLHLLWVANFRRPYPRAHLDDDIAAFGPWRYGSPVLDLLGVRWVLAPRNHPPRARGFRRAFAGADGIDVWANDEALPRAFVVFRARSVRGEAEAARAVADPDWDPARVAIVEGALANLPPPSADAPPPAVPALQVGRPDATRFTATVTLRSPGVLVVSEPWYPGWEVRVDGRPAPLLRVDLALRGVALDAGTHTVTMTLSAVPVRVGMALSMLALCATAAVAALGARRRANGAVQDPASTSVP